MKHSKFIFLPMLFFCAASILLLGSCSDEPVTCLKPKQFYVANMKFNLSDANYGGCAYLNENGNHEINLLILYLDTKTGKLSATPSRTNPSIIGLRIHSQEMRASPDWRLQSALSQGYRRQKTPPPLVQYKKEASITEVTHYSRNPKIPPVVEHKRQPEESTIIYYFDDPQFNYVIECTHIFENTPASCRTTFVLPLNVFAGTVKVSFGEEILTTNIKKMTYELFEVLRHETP